jgi:hypothetical protein
MSGLCCVKAMLCQGYAASRLCYATSGLCCIKAMLCQGYAASMLCYVRAILHQGYAMSGLCYVKLAPLQYFNSRDQGWGKYHKVPFIIRGFFHFQNGISIHFLHWNEMYMVEIIITLCMWHLRYISCWNWTNWGTAGCYKARELLTRVGLWWQAFCHLYLNESLTRSDRTSIPCWEGNGGPRFRTSYFLLGWFSWKIHLKIIPSWQRP